MSHIFLELPYAYDALGTLHRCKNDAAVPQQHHRTYYDKFVAAVSAASLNSNLSLKSSLIFLSTAQPFVTMVAATTTIFCIELYVSRRWRREPTGELGEVNKSTFGDFANIPRSVRQAAINTFGSGFAWLVVEEGQLKIISTSNQDNPWCIQLPVTVSRFWRSMFGSTPTTSATKNRRPISAQRMVERSEFGKCGFWKLRTSTRE